MFMAGFSLARLTVRETGNPERKQAEEGRSLLYSCPPRTSSLLHGRTLQNGLNLSKGEERSEWVKSIKGRGRSEFKEITTARVEMHLNLRPIKGLCGA